MFVSQPVLKSLALLVFLVPSSSVVAQQEEESDNPSLMTNFNAMREEGQGFYLDEKAMLYEKPDAVTVSTVSLHWWCDLEFLSDDATSNYGYVGRGVGKGLGARDDIRAQDSQVVSSVSQSAITWRPFSVSAVMVPTLGIFEGQYHATHDDWVRRTGMMEVPHYQF